MESGVGHTQKTPLEVMRFETLDEAQAYLDRWDTRWADTRIHGTTRRQVAAMFAEEQPALGRLPLDPFRCYRFGVGTVHLDGYVEVEAASDARLAQRSFTFRTQIAIRSPRYPPDAPLISTTVRLKGDDPASGKVSYCLDLPNPNGVQRRQTLHRLRTITDEPCFEDQTVVRSR